MKKIIFLIIFVPVFASATGITDGIDAAFDIVTKVLTPLAFSLCLLYFFWGVAKYIRDGASSDKAAEEGKRIMISGIVALFVVTSIWGIIAFMRNEIGLPDIKTINTVQP